MKRIWTTIAGIVAALAVMAAFSHATYAQQPQQEGVYQQTQQSQLYHQAQRRGAEQLPLVVAADTIGITVGELHAELAAGKSIAQVATENNVDVDTVVDALVAHATERLDTLVAEGRITQAQADARLATVRNHITERVNQEGLPQRGPGGPDQAMPAVIADAIGITPAELHAELVAGKSIAQVAAEHNVDVDTVIDAMVAHITERLNTLVAEGRITQAQADARLATLRDHLTARVNREGLPQRGPERPGRPGQSGPATP